MGYNKIPLALRYNDTTNNAEGLIEFQLNLSDAGDVCSSTPSNGQGLVWSGGGDGSWCPSTLPTGGGGGTPTLPAGGNGDLLINTGGGTTYFASAASDAGIMQLDPYFDANDEGAVAQWDGTKLEVAFPDQLYMLVEAGEDLSKGDVVYVTGDAGNGRFIVAKADASDPSKMPAVGLAPAAISNTTNGKIVSFGRAIGLNTAGMTVGKPVYVATTAGGITKDKPTGATDLIQNIGIVSVVDGTNGVIKVTGVGRSNDIPNNVDVVGSATIGTNEFTQTSAKLANVGADHILISTAASATSSILSSTLFSNYYTKSEVYTQTQANAQFLEETTNLTGIADVTGTPAANHILQRNSLNNNWDPVTMNAALLATGERVEDHNIEDLANVTNGEGYTDGDVLVYQSGDSTSFQPFASSIFTTQADSIDHGLLQGLGDDDHTQYVLANGTRAITGDLSTVGVSATSGSVATTPTAANHIANKSYVDSQIPTPSYMLAIASGQHTSLTNTTPIDIGWTESGNGVISDPTNSVSVDQDTSASIINVSADGVYQIDLSLQTSNSGGRVGAYIDVYVSRSGGSFQVSSQLQSANYNSRAVGNGENIFKGTCHLNTLISLNNGDRLQFWFEPRFVTGVPIVLQEGTYLRIIKIA